MATRHTIVDNRFENGKRFRKIPVLNVCIRVTVIIVCVLYYYYQRIKRESLAFRLWVTSSLEIRIFCYCRAVTRGKSHAEPLTNFSRDTLVYCKRKLTKVAETRKKMTETIWIESKTNEEVL